MKLVAIVALILILVPIRVYSKVIDPEELSEKEDWGRIFDVDRFDYRQSIK